MRKKYRKSSHAVYEVKYHFVFCPKYRYGVLEGKILEDHVHVCLSVPPKYSPSEVMKQIKGNSSERLFREFPDLKKRCWGQHLWARGYFVSTVGADEETIKKYIKEQKKPDRIETQLKLWG